jgi:guanylate kinase
MEVILQNKHTFREILKDYKPSPESIAFLNDMDLVILQGVTAAGRNTIINELVKRGTYKYVVSDTTRPPKLRDGIMEQDGVQYYFRSEEAMLADLQAGKFLEAELIHEQQVSGISIRELENAKASGKIPINEVDVIGPVNIRKAKPDTCFIFVLPPSFEEWQRRWMAREEITEQEIDNRMRTAERALEAALAADYFSFVINDEVTAAADKIDQIVQGIDSVEDEQKARAIAEDLLEKVRKYLAR